MLRSIAQRAPGRRTGLVAALLAVALTATGIVGFPDPADADPVGVSAAGYQATIRRTAFGVPHVLAADLGGVAFGQGWAYAEDRFCDLADQIVKVRSERSRWFGPGRDGANLATDLAYLSLGVVERARRQEAGLSTQERAALGGYVAGFNGYLAATGPARVPGWCAGQPWIGPITAIDVLAYQRDIALLASGANLLAPIALAQPPGTAAARLPVAPALVAEGLRRVADQRRGEGATGSNGWAIGADRSVHGKGMLVANPHFPWQGELKFWESHLTVPGKLNVYGAGLGGLPGVQIGFTEKVAWTHTVAEGARFTFYTVDLVPGSPTTYLVDGEPEAMTANPVTVAVKGDDGVVRPHTRTMWSTRYGPVLDLSSVDPSLGWSTSLAVTYRDANIDNDRLLRQWYGISQATDVFGVRDAIARDHGIPWVNTIVADSQGNAAYADSSPTPNLSPSALAEWSSNPLGLLNGSSSANAWVVRPGARSPGLIPFADQPQLLRRDYVLNANDSHWFANQHRPLTGFSPLQGPEGTPLSVRTRQNVKLVNGAPGGRFDLPGLGAAILSDTAYTSDELTTAAVAACRQRGSTPVVVDGTPVDLGPACPVLASWDRRFDPGSSGAVLWRETIDSVVAAHPTALERAGPLFEVPFDPTDPANTPRGPAADPTPLLAGLARAVIRLRSGGFPLNVRLGAVQYTLKGAERIPVPGAGDTMGIANVVDHLASPGTSREPVLDPGPSLSGTALTTEGYVINDGTSFLLTVAFTASGPVARGLLTFGESADPRSPHFADQTRLFSQKRLRDCRFTEAAIAGDPELRVKVVRQP